MVNASGRRNQSPSSFAPAPKRQRLGPLDVILELLNEINAAEASQLYATLGNRLRNRGFPRTLERQGFEKIPSSNASPRANGSSHTTPNPITINLISDEEENNGGRMSMNDTSQVHLDNITKSELEDVNKAKKDFLQLQVDLKDSMQTEECKMWALPDTYTGLLGKYHLAKITVELKKQKYRKKRLLCLGKPQDFLDHATIGRDLKVVTEEQQEGNRKGVVAVCKKMTVRCGGLAKLRARSDDCSTFLDVCASNFNIADEELEEKKPLPKISPYAHLPEYSVMKAAQKELDDAKKKDGCFFWQVSDVSLLGKTLFARAKFYLRQQEIWRNDLSARGASPEVVKGANLGPDLVRLSQEEEASYRYRVLSQCGHLSFRCGGLDLLLERNDDCAKFLQLAMEANYITPKELQTAYSNYRDVAVERSMCEKNENREDVLPTAENSVIAIGGDIKL